MLKWYAVLMRLVGAVLVCFATACGGGGGGGGGDDDTEILVRFLNQHTVSGVASEIVLKELWYGNSSILLRQKLAYGEYSDWIDIGQGATSRFSGSASLEYAYRAQGSSGLWSSLDSTGLPEIAGKDLHAGESYSIVLSGNGTAVMHGTVLGDPDFFFSDSDADPQEVSGDVRLLRADDESDIDAYSLHWGADGHSKLASGSEIASWQPGTGVLSHRFDPGTSVPVGATHLLLYVATDFYPEGALYGSLYVDTAGDIQNPTPQGNHLQGVAYGQGTFVAVGGRGSVITSSDGVVWENQNSGIQRELSDVTFANNRFVAGGDDFILVASAGADDWEPVNTDLALNGIDVCNDIYVATGENKSIMVSQDADLWLMRVRGGNHGWHAAAHNGSLHVVVGNGISTSEDNIVWEEQLSGSDIFSDDSSELRDTIWTGDAFYAAGDGGTLISASDGVNWTIQNVHSDMHFRGIAYGADRFVAVGRDLRDGTLSSKACIVTSQDGNTWEEVAIETWPDLNAVIHADGKFVAVGEDGLILTSQDGLAWRRRSTGPHANMNAVVTGAGQVPIAVGDQGYIATWNGSGWDRVESGVPADLHAILYRSGSPAYIAVGHDSTVVTSADGSNWRVQTDVPPDLYLGHVVYGDGVYVVTGHDFLLSNKTLRSTNAVNWVEVSTGTTRRFGDILYADNQFVTTAYGGGIYISPAGEDGTWTPIDTPADALNTIVSANGSYYAGGWRNGMLIVSLDQGATWSDLTSGFAFEHSSTGLDAAGDCIVSSGLDSILLSPDNGLSWWEPIVPVDGRLNDIVYTGTHFLAVGDGGLTVTLAP